MSLDVDEASGGFGPLDGVDAGVKETAREIGG